MLLQRESESEIAPRCLLLSSSGEIAGIWDPEPQRDPGDATKAIECRVVFESLYQLGVPIRWALHLACSGTRIGPNFAQYAITSQDSRSSYVRQ